MQILGYIIGFILILAVIFIPICLVAFGVPFLLILLFRLLRGILYCFLDLFTKKKRIPGYWNKNFGRESLKNLAGKCCYWAFLIITFFFDSDDDGGSSDSGSSGGGGSFGGGGAGRSFLRHFTAGFSHFWKNSSLCKKNIYGKLITPVYEKISRSYFLRYL